MTLPHPLTDVLRAKAICFVTTLLPDGSPQVSQTWVDTDGEHVVINTVDTHQKARNMTRDSRVALGIADPASPLRSWGIRGRVLSMSSDGAREHLDGLSTKYLGRPYPGFGGPGGGQRVVVTIAVDAVHTP